jgi:hypothetical protein
MPESPFYFIMKNRIQEAQSSLQKLRAWKTVEAELDSLVSDVTRQMCERGRFSDLVTIKSNKMAVIVMAILRFLQQFSGVSSFTFYAQILFIEATDAIPQQWAAMLMMVIQAIFTLLAVLIVDVVGRMGDNVNQVLNDNWREVFDDVIQDYIEVFNKILIAVFNNLFSKVSLEDAFD